MMYQKDFDNNLDQIKEDEANYNFFKLQDRELSLLLLLPEKDWDQPGRE